MQGSVCIVYVVYVVLNSCCVINNVFVYVICMCTYVCMNTCRYVCMYVCTYVCMCVQCKCVRMHACMYACMCVSVCSM